MLQFVFPAAEIIQGMDITADPCEDFYRFACGGWMDSNAIPDGKNKWGRFYELRGAVDKALKGLCCMFYCFTSSVLPIQMHVDI